jgi:thiol-disulfide isomerase/thioredoxin
MRKKIAALLSPAIIFLLSGGMFSTVAGGVGTPAPEILEQSWLNSEPLRLAQLRDKVILVEFWTFGCYNCRNVEPHIKTWHQRYAEKGLVVIGVHSPEYIRIGEGGYLETERRIQALLEEASGS